MTSMRSYDLYTVIWPLYGRAPEKKRRNAVRLLIADLFLGPTEWLFGQNERVSE